MLNIYGNLYKITDHISLLNFNNKQLKLKNSKIILNYIPTDIISLLNKSLTHKKTVCTS